MVKSGNIIDHYLEVPIGVHENERFIMKNPVEFSKPPFIFIYDKRVAATPFVHV